MTRILKCPTAWLALGVVLAALGAVPAVADDPPEVDNLQPFQFADSFYLQHGVDPTNLVDKYTFPDAKFPECAADPFATRCRTRQDEASPDPAIYSDIRVIETTGGFKHNGNLLYYLSPSKINPGDFIDNAAGDATRELCDEFRAFLFPKAAGDPLSPGFPNRRQDNIFETNGGYFGANQLGCWSLAFVSWDGPDINSPDCQDEMADLADDNGVDLDGTPMIRKMNEAEDMAEEGCARIRFRNSDGSQGFPWVT